MKSLVNAALAYLVAGLASGLFYREFTRQRGFGPGSATQLSVAHTHLLTLGFLVLLLVLVLERLFTLSASTRLFRWFLGAYNAGVVITSAMLVTNGVRQVLGSEPSKALAGISGLGHMLTALGLVLLMVALSRAVGRAAGAGAPTPA